MRCFILVLLLVFVSLFFISCDEIDAPISERWKGKSVHGVVDAIITPSVSRIYDEEYSIMCWYYHRGGIWCTEVERPREW